MLKCIIVTFLVFLTFQSQASELYHRQLCAEHAESIWEETAVVPFDELILSWDATRPEQGYYLFEISALIDGWSPWLNYAFWGANNQYTFNEKKANVQTFQDAFEISNGQFARGFRVRITAKEGASLEKVRGLHACLTNRTKHGVEPQVANDKAILVSLDVPRTSQIVLPDERHMRLCSPTSTTAVINFHKEGTKLSPTDFANRVVDTAFDIYGNWILNTAQAAHELGDPWGCFVVRLTSFDQVIDQLLASCPVVVSVRGPLAGSAMPYEAGHLLVVKGYNSATREVLCMDPAFATNAQTVVAYPLDGFVNAWARRQGIAYVIQRYPMH